MPACMLGPGFFQGAGLVPVSQVTKMASFSDTAPWGITHLHPQ